jgi:hypothetical protein
MKRLIMQLVQFYCYFCSLGSKYLLRHPVLEYLHPMFSLDVRPNFTSVQRRNKIMFLYILIFIFLDNKRYDKKFWTEW